MIEFSTAHFWAKAYDISQVRHMKAFVKLLAAQMGTFVDSEEEYMFGIDKSLCFRV